MIFHLLRLHFVPCIGFRDEQLNKRVIQEPNRIVCDALDYETDRAKRETRLHDIKGLGRA